MTPAIPYTAECRACERTVRETFPVATFEDIHGVRLRCAECETTTWATVSTNDAKHTPG